MPTANELLQDAAISHQVDIQHYSNAEVRKIIALLNKADLNLTLKLQDAIERLGSDSFTARHVDAVLENVRSLNKETYTGVAETFHGDMEKLAEYELSYQDKLFTTVIPATVLEAKPLASVTMQQVRDIAFKRPFQGKLLSEWMGELETARAVRIRDAIRTGMVEGLTVSQMVQRIRGTKAEGYNDGLLNRSRREIETIVRTAIGHVSNSSRDAFYSANDDIIESQDWLSTLDGRTSPPCRLRDGLRYKPTSHKPIGHSIPWLAGPGRLHHQCRSTSVPRLKLWSELGIDPKDMPPATRASMDGTVPADMTYSDWLKKQSPERQDEILGKDKGALFRTGQLPLDGFYNDKGKVLTLDELKARHPVPYQKAGLDNPIRPPRGMPQDLIAKFLADKEAQTAHLTEIYKGQGMSYPSQLEIVKGVKKQQGYSSTPEALSAARWYTGNGYYNLNKRARSGEETLRDRQTQALTAAALPGMGQHKGAVYRAPTTRQARSDFWWEKAIIGREMDIGDQFQSFSASREFAAGWSGSSDILFRIEQPKSGAYIDPISLHPGEHEVLLPPGLKYVVKGKTTDVIDGKPFRVVDLEIVSDE